MKTKKKIPFLLRLNSVRKEIKYAFIVSLISIVIIELLLKRVSSYSYNYSRIGDIYLKLCYSIVAASIFYFINQHLPKEEKKLRSYRFINNKLASINDEIRKILKNLKIPNEINNYDDITEEMINDACSKIHPMTPLNTDESNIPFENWYVYFNYKSLKIKENIRDLLLLNESIDTDLLEKILIMDDTVSRLYMDKVRYGNTNLIFWTHSIYELKLESENAYKIKSLKYKTVGQEYHQRFRANRLLASNLSDSKINWSLWYFGVLAFLTMQIVFYYLFTKYWA